VEAFLELLSEDNYDAFCLAYMFTYRDFDGGTLGLAWTGDVNNAGGVCERNGVRLNLIVQLVVKKRNKRCETKIFRLHTCLTLVMLILVVFLVGLLFTDKYWFIWSDHRCYV